MNCFHKAVGVYEKIERKLTINSPVLFQNSTINFDEITKKFTTGGERVGVVYMHFLFTHFPSTLDENCDYRGNDSDWSNQYQNEAGVRNTTICGLKKLKTFLDRLIESGIYDNSLIVLNSDHGKPVSYFSSSPNSLRINNNPHWGFNRYRPMLLIKDVGANNDIMEYDERIVLLDDIAKTTCRSVESSDFCNHVKGLDLLEDNAEAPENFIIHVVKDEDSTWKRGTHMAVQISRKVPLEAAMRDHDQIILSNSSTVDRPIIGGIE